MKRRLCDCANDCGDKPKKITNGYICQRCHDIEKRMYKDERNGKAFKYINVYDKISYKEIGSFSLS